jgi:hypothetical protein
MILLPWETFVIETPLNKDKVIAELKNNIEPEKVFRRWNQPGAKKFEGFLAEDGFEITKLINYKNSFNPVIRGRVESSGDVTRLTVKLRLPVVVLGFMIVWFGGLASISLAQFAGPYLGSYFSLFSNENAISFPMALVPPGMLLFGYAIMMGGYLHESKAIKNTLTKITRGKVVNNVS